MNLSLIHHSHLSSDALNSCWPSSHQADVKILGEIEKIAHRNWCMPLRGINNFPLQRSLVLDRFSSSVPIADLDPNFALSWADISDQMAIELIARAKATNKKIMLSWSGGVDSTVILIALLKHLGDQDKDLLTVALTKASIFESSQIYFKYLHGQFAIVDFDLFFDSFCLEQYQQYIHVNGDPADQLCIGINSSSRLFLQDPSWGEKSFKETLQLKKLLTLTFDQTVAEWLTPRLIENIESTDAPIQSCYQATWWLAFNYFFGGSFCATWCHTWWEKGLTFEQWMTNQFLWFSDSRYQKWAFVNCGRYDLLFGPDINQWKWMSKQYIADYTKDFYWLRYKTKMASNNRRTQRSNPEWVALHGDQLLTIKNDIDKLKELLPQCLC